MGQPVAHRVYRVFTNQAATGLSRQVVVEGMAHVTAKYWFRGAAGASISIQLEAILSGQVEKLDADNSNVDEPWGVIGTPMTDIQQGSAGIVIPDTMTQLVNGVSLKVVRLDITALDLGRATGVDAIICVG